jgi:hypothetical protein
MKPKKHVQKSTKIKQFGNLADFCLAIWRIFVWQFGGFLLGKLADFRIRIFRNKD